MLSYCVCSEQRREFIVRNTVNKALQRDPTLAAALLRMHFHDCFVQGCDASVLIDSSTSNTAEKDSPPNLSLRGFEIIDQAKQIIEHQCPGTVSCADILALAARDAVGWAGGPSYVVPNGRKDGRRSRIEDTTAIPPPFFNTTDLIKRFGEHGFSVPEMVALSGAHTLGVARCSSFKNRLSNSDPTLDPNFATTLFKTCSAGDNTQTALDRTSNSFDNDYFNAMQTRGGLLTSDQSLFLNPQTRSVVNAYAMNQHLFFCDFSQAMMKMGLLNVKEGADGEIRLNCHRVN